MHITYASEQGTGSANEDHVSAGPDWAFVLDGATAAPGVDSGCLHGVRWLVDRLAEALTTELTRARPGRLTDVLAAAIERVRAAHGGTCDLGNPDSPSSTAAVIRRRSEGVEYLVLADTTILVPEEDTTVTAITDDRLDHLPGGRPYTRELVRSQRNAPGGFWVASTVPEAAHQAVTGVVPGTGRPFALMTDGCSRLVEYYGYTWHEVWRHLEQEGPRALISRVRGEERTHGTTRAKPHDDATVLIGALSPA